MEIFNLKEKQEFLKEYFELCVREWSDVKSEEEISNKINKKINKYNNSELNNIISALVLVDNNKLIGFISLFDTDGDEHIDLTPWYATMYVKKEYRGLGYSKVLNDSILKESKKLGYNKVYLKSDLINYYEKFGAKYIEKLINGEKLYYIDLN